jgi:hypothetical protein
MILLRLSLLALLVALSLFGALAAVDSAQPAPSAVRVVVVGPEDTAAVVEAHLSSVEGFEVIARSELKELWGEQIVASLADHLPSLGRLAGVDVFLSLEEGPLLTLKLVNAATAEEIARSSTTADNLKEEAVRLLSTNHVWTQKSLVPIAISEPEDAHGRAAAMALSEWLSAAGHPILNRRITWNILEERARVEDGFVDTEESLPPFPAASRLLQIKSGPEGVTLGLLASDGSLLGHFLWADAPVPDEALKQFLHQHLSRVEAETPAEFRQRVNVEASLPFYEGVTLFESGEPLAAMLKFQEAYEMNHLFVAAYEWEMRCYKSLRKSLRYIAGVGYY